MQIREDMVGRKGMDIVMSWVSEKYSLKFPLGSLYRSLPAFVPMALMLCTPANAQTIGESGAIDTGLLTITTTFCGGCNFLTEPPPEEES